MAATNPRVIEKLQIRIGRHGTWYHEDIPIVRPELVKLFASMLRRSTDGKYWLETPAEVAQVEVEDAPFIVIQLNQQGSGLSQKIDFLTNVDRWFALDGAHALRFGVNDSTLGSVPYVSIGGGLEARLSTSVYYELVELAEVDEHNCLGVWSYDQRHVLGLVE
ncbi:MAG: DUF1285 domain-containing protein [Pseudomonadota bacterium]